jgi:hypothetical protein
MAREMKLLTWRRQTCSRSINSVLSCSIIMHALSFPLSMSFSTNVENVASITSFSSITTKESVQQVIIEHDEHLKHNTLSHTCLGTHTCFLIY